MSEQGLEIPALLRACAEGREEYANAALGDAATVLRAEANALFNAARLAEGELAVAYGLIPSWRWVDVGLPDPSRCIAGPGRHRNATP